MGLEAHCTARYKRRVSQGVAQLETQELRFKGDFRFAIPYADMKSVVASKGTLRVETRDEVATLELGPKAETWALKIRYPKPLIEKLGVKAGQVISVLGIEDAAFLRDARSRAAEIATGRPKKDSDLVFFGVTKASELSRLPRLEEAIRREGAIWVVWKKGEPTLKEDHVRAAALRAGLVDVKVVSFSETHSALKLMIRRADR